MDGSRVVVEACERIASCVCLSMNMSCGVVWCGCGVSVVSWRDGRVGTDQQVETCRAVDFSTFSHVNVQRNATLRSVFAWVAFSHA